jgi:hypothetical protein
MNKWFNKEDLPAKSEEQLWQLAEVATKFGSPWTCEQFLQDLAECSQSLFSSQYTNGWIY